MDRGCNMSSFFLLYDARARDEQCRDDASVLDAADTEDEAIFITKANHFDGYELDAIWYEFDIDVVGKSLMNPRQRADLS